MHPYKAKPDYQFWKKAGGLDEPQHLDPVVSVSFKITKDEPVLTAGSCFAQHVARRLSENGFNYHVCEPGHPIMDGALKAKFSYGVFSARYGNIYTARQLKQLLERAYGLRTPLETAWPLSDGAVVDPFRPQIQPEGFISEDELRIDRRQHFASIRQGIESMSVFVFTLGLTETWVDVRDGSVFPLAPGVAGGDFDDGHYEFKNFTVSETVEDMRWALDFIRARNPSCKFIITVSPVPLNATAVDRHVLVSTVYSKSVLRVAAEEICQHYDMADYFPSYEIITSPHAGGLYFAEDKRSVTERGVDHVMGIFLKHYGQFDVPLTGIPSDTALKSAASEKHLKEMEDIVQVLCDEEAITNN